MPDPTIDEIDGKKYFIITERNDIDVIYDDSDSESERDIVEADKYTRVCFYELKKESYHKIEVPSYKIDRTLMYLSIDSEFKRISVLTESGLLDKKTESIIIKRGSMKAL